MRHEPSVRANSWEDIADLSASLGVPLDEWQELVLQSAMGERSDGRWASRIVGVSTPRQNGKSQLIVARALAGVLLFGEQMIICSAHQTDTAREVFQRLLDIIDANPSVARRVAPNGIMRAINRESIRFVGGSTIKVKARSVSGSRGFSADCLLLDEAQILGSPAWSSILPTMSARENPQAWLLGTPPTPQDDGEVFTRLRQQSIEGKASRVSYLEWSADDTDDLNDPATWAKANPAFGTRISVEAIEAERAAMSDQQFAMERLGMWSPVTGKTLFPISAWRDAGDEKSRPADRLALGVEAAPDLSTVSVVLAGMRSDGGWHVELQEQRPGSAWAAPYVSELLALNPGIRAVGIDAGSPSSALLRDFRTAGVRVESPTVRELGAACALLLEGVVTGSVRHIGQHQLTAAAMAASKRNLGDTGMWTFSRRAAVADITPIQGAVLALWASRLDRVKQPRLTGGRTSGRRTGVVL